MRRRASLATESADRRVNNLAEHRSTESEAGRSQTGLDVESRFTEGRISEGSVVSALFPASSRSGRQKRAAPLSGVHSTSTPRARPSCNRRDGPAVFFPDATAALPLRSFQTGPLARTRSTRFGEETIHANAFDGGIHRNRSHLHRRWSGANAACGTCRGGAVARLIPARIRDQTPRRVLLPARHRPRVPV